MSCSDHQVRQCGVTSDAGWSDGGVSHHHGHQECASVGGGLQVCKSRQLLLMVLIKCIACTG